MTWHDGSAEFGAAELTQEYPVMVTGNLRLTGDGRKLAVINDFPRGTALYELADPKVEEDEEGKHIFCHVFLDKDAVAAERAISAFVSTADLKDGRSILLLRKEEDSMFSYAYGHICISLLNDQASLRSVLPEDMAEEENVFILPLNRFMFRCPVCGHRTLPERAAFHICGECGWEDEGIDGDEEQSFGPNGEYTIKEYRNEYLKLKAEDPEYSWAAQFEK